MAKYAGSYQKLKKLCDKNSLTISQVHIINDKEVVLINNRLLVYLSNHYWFDLKYRHSTRKDKIANSGGEKLKSRMKKVAKDFNEHKANLTSRYTISFHEIKEEFALSMAKKLIK